MDLSQYKAAVHEIANKVDQLITKDTTARTRFTKHIDRFCKMVEDYEQALQPYKEKLKTSDNMSAVLKELRSVQPAKLVNPLCWLGVSRGYAYGYEFCWLFGVFGDMSKLPRDPTRDNVTKLQRDATEDEQLMCEYVLLAIIHDWELNEPTDRRVISNKYNSKEFIFIGMVPDGEGIRFTESGTVKLTDICRWVWKYFLNPVLGEPGLIETRPIASEALQRLNRALEHIQAGPASEQERAGTNAVGADTKHKDKNEEPQPRNYIKKGSIWQICFEGQTIPIDGGLRGLPLIAYLLQNPQKPISALDLEQAVAKIPPDKVLKMSALAGDLKDDENGVPGLTITNTSRTINTRELAKADVDELKAAITNLEKQRDDTENASTREGLDDQIDTLEEELERKTNKGGGARPTEGDPYEQARVRVIQKIDRVKKILFKDYKKLYDHLDLCLKIGAECSYTPENPQNWQFF